MSEVQVDELPSDDVPASPSAKMTAGMMMRKAREAAGLHVAALAVSMKMPVKKLEALEADRLDLLHDAVFVRALASSVCRTLKIDPAPVLEKLPLNTAPRLTGHDGGINTPFHASGDMGGKLLPAALSKPQAIVVVLLLVGVLGVIFFPEMQSADSALSNSPAQTKAPEFSEGPLAEKTGEGSVENVVVKPAVVSSGAAQAISGPPGQASQQRALASSSETLGTPLRQAATSVLVGSNPALHDKTVSTVKTIVFKARSNVWVKVVDGNGAVQLSKTLVSGETITAAGQPPLSVVVGRADSMDVEIGGKTFALAEVSKENVARFEVK